MRRQTVFTLVLSVVAGGVVGLMGCATTGQGSSSSARYQPRAHQTFRLENGLKVTVVEDNSLPLLSLSLLVKAGSSADPSGADGVSSFVAQMLDKGTLRRDEEKLTNDLSEYAGQFSSSTNEDFALFSMSSLSTHGSRLVSDFYEIMTEPRFSSTEIERYRKRLVASLRSIVDEPSQVAELGFDGFMFGEHPYGRSSSGRIHSVRGLKRDQIVRQYRLLYEPSNSHLLVVGQVSTELLAQLRSTFGAWKGKGVPAQPPLGPVAQGQREILIIDKSDLKQSQIRFGHIGIRRNDPDFIPLRVASTILGGGFTSRLMKEVREKRGLTYAIWSYNDTKLEPGAFVIGTFSRNEKVGETLQEVLRVVTEMRDQGVSEKEVRAAVNYLKGQFPQSLETAESFGVQLLYLDFYGVPSSYFSTYLDDLEKLKASDVVRVIRKHWRPETLKVVVHGPKDAVMPQVKGLGPVQIKEPLSLLE